MKLYKTIGYPPEDEHHWTLDLSQKELEKLMAVSDELLATFDEWHSVINMIYKK